MQQYESFQIPFYEQNNIDDMGFELWSLFDNKLFGQGPHLLRDLREVAEISRLNKGNENSLASLVATSRLTRQEVLANRFEMNEKYPWMHYLYSNEGHGMYMEEIDIQGNPLTLIGISRLGMQGASLTFKFREHVLKYGLHLSDGDQTRYLGIFIPSKPINRWNSEILVKESFTESQYPSKMVDFKFEVYPNDVFYVKYEVHDYDKKEERKRYRDGVIWYQKWKDVEFLGKHRPVYLTLKGRPEDDRYGKRGTKATDPFLQLLASRLMPRMRPHGA